MKFKEHFLTYTLVPLVVLMIGASYMRFMVIQDYVVAYEGDCDPIVNDCFVGCDNEDCTEEYYYSIVTRHTSDIRNLCGVDISDCETTNTCTVDESECFITHCDFESEGDVCDTLDSSSL